MSFHQIIWKSTKKIGVGISEVPYNKSGQWGPNGRWEGRKTLSTVSETSTSNRINPYKCENNEVWSSGELLSLHITTQMEILRIRSTKMYSDLKVGNSLHFKKSCSTAVWNGLQKKYIFKKMYFIVLLDGCELKGAIFWNSPKGPLTPLKIQKIGAYLICAFV